MILIDSKNTNKVLGFIPLVRASYSEWHIITLKFRTTNKEEAERLLYQFINVYEDTEGFCYLESNNKATSIIKLGKIQSYSEIQNNIEKNIDGQNCKVLAEAKEKRLLWKCKGTVDMEYLPKKCQPLLQNEDLTESNLR